MLARVRNEKDNCIRSIPNPDAAFQTGWETGISTFCMFEVCVSLLKWVVLSTKGTYNKIEQAKVKCVTLKKGGTPFLRFYFLSVEYGF